MRAFIDRMLTQLKEYFGKMSRGSKIRLAILTILVIALAIVAVVLMTRTNYKTMYTAQDQAEAGNIYNALVEMGVPVRIDGTKIMVPEERVSELQASLASQGMIGAAGPDSSIMESAAGFSVTESHAQKLYERQDAADIRNAILTSPKIQNANVIVKYGDSSPFSRPTNAKQATCSVMLTLARGATLTNQEAQTIAEHVKASVQGINYENISITDTNFNHYKVGDESMDFGSEMDSRIALQNQLSRQIQSQGEQLLTPIFGVSNVRVTPTVRLNFDRIVSEAVEFEPPVAGEMDGIVRSSSELWEAQRSNDTAEGIPGTDSNGMGTAEYPYGTLADNEYYAKAVVEKNYEINETRTVIEKEQGKIEYLSVAILINELATEDDYTGEVANLVSTGLGIMPENVTVERVPFYIDPSIEENEQAAKEYEEIERRKELTEMITKWAVILLLGIAMIILIGMIVKAAKPVPEPQPVLVDGGGYGIEYIADDEEEITDVSDEEEEEVELQTKSTGLEQIEKFIDKDPAAVAQLLRNWLTDE